MPSAQSSLRSISMALLCSIMLVSTLLATPTHKQVFVGEVGDAMCGRKHVDQPAADCAHTCVAHGSKYTLIVGEKIYTLQTSDKAVLAMLDLQAGKHVTIIGRLHGDSIRVSSVAQR